MLIGLVRGCHPAPTAAVTLVTALLCVGAGGSASTTLLATVTVLTGQLSIGWSNDWLDAGRDAGRSDKPVATGAVAPTTLRTASLVALALTVVLSVAWPQGLWQLVLVASGWLYNVGVKATAWSPLPYAVGFAALPTYVLVLVGVEVTWWLPACGALLGVAAHFANVAPDIETDRAHGVEGLPQRVGATRSLVVSLVLLAACGVLLLAEVELAPLLTAFASLVVLLPVAVGLWALGRGEDRPWVFRLVMVAAVLDVALLAAAA